MIFWRTMSCIQSVILIVLVFDKTDHVRTEENRSVFSFLHTGKTSPMNIRHTCFDIDKASVNSMYLGISVFVNKNMACELENIGLTEVQKYIILDKHQRQLCRTKLTMSINSINCEKAIEDLKYMCQHLDEKSTIFFHDCMFDSIHEQNETFTESEAIIISEFPTSNIGELGHAYEIPTIHCNMNECELKNANKVRELRTSPSKEISYPDSDKGSARRVLFQAIVTGCAGLIVGVSSTLFVCICIYMKNQSRIINDGLISKPNIHCMNETERIVSTRSKEDENVYHDVLDIVDPTNETDIQHSVSDVFCHHDPSEQRYIGSPKSSTSTYENKFATSQISVNKDKKSSKEHASRKEPSGVYHTLSKENNFGLERTENGYLYEKKNVDIENTATSKTIPSSLKSEQHEQDATYEVPESHSNAKICRDIRSKTSAMSAVNDDNEDLTTTVYHVLEKKEEIYPAT